MIFTYLRLGRASSQLQITLDSTTRNDLSMATCMTITLTTEIGRILGVLRGAIHYHGQGWFIECDFGSIATFKCLLLICGLLFSSCY